VILVQIWPELLASTVILAALLTLISLSWVIVYRTTAVLNFAVGQYAIVGSYFVFAILSRAHVAWGLAAAISLACSAALGAFTYFGLLRPLTARPLWAPVILTMGIAFMLDALFSMIWGDQIIFLPLPTTNRTFHLGHGALVNVNDLLTLGAAVVTFLAVLAFMRRTRVGVQMQAAAELPLLASQGGINVDVMFAMGWALSALVAAIGGIAYTLNAPLVPGAVSIGLLGLAPALLGGLDSVEGVVAGSIVAALVSNIASLYLGGGAMDAAAAVLVLVVLLIRPQGLFGIRSVLRI
jgi:branched-chain amino acid transport system permease protein